MPETEPWAIEEDRSLNEASRQDDTVAFTIADVFIPVLATVTFDKTSVSQTTSVGLDVSVLHTSFGRRSFSAGSKLVS